MTFSPDDNPEIEHDVYLRRLPPAKPGKVEIFCHATCVNPAVWAIVTPMTTMRLCLVHLDDLTETLVFLRRRIREKQEA